MATQFCPSLMCADLSRLAEELNALEQAGAAMFHIDIMDGCFVPNFALGPEVINAVARLAHIPYDAHLMVANPDPYLERFAALGCSIIYVHAEAPQHLHRTLSRIRKLGVKAGVALNPGTSLSTIEEVLDAVDVVLIMSVDPGFAGQPFIPSTIDKIRRLKGVLQQHHSAAQIAIDGAISADIVENLAAEVDIFILGSAGLFRPDLGYAQAIGRLQQRADKAIAAAQ